MHTGIFALAALLSALQLSEVEAHGAMSFPPPRNRLFPNYCAHCANGNGVCGDGSGSQWISSSEPSTTYGPYFQLERPIIYAGGLVEVSIYITAAHKGLFTMEMCRNPGNILQEDCFERLNRDPTDISVSPYLPEAPHLFFLLENNCMAVATEGSPLTARFIVPQGTETGHAVLRYRWQTGNSCAPTTYNKLSTADERLTSWSVTFNGVSNCVVAISDYELCGTDCPNASCSSERFSNCADVAVRTASSSGIVVSKSQYSVTSDPVDSSGTGTSTAGVALTTLIPTTAVPTTAVPTTAVPTTAVPTTAVPTTAGQTTAGQTTAGQTMPPASTTENVVEGTTTVATTTMAACTPGGPIVGTVDGCQAKVASITGHFDDYCKTRCADISAGEDTATRWCLINKWCDLSECVVNYHSNVCMLI